MTTDPLFALERIKAEAQSHIASNEAWGVQPDDWAVDRLAAVEYLGNVLERHEWGPPHFKRGCNICGRSDEPCRDYLAALALIAQLDGGTT